MLKIVNWDLFMFLHLNHHLQFLKNLGSIFLLCWFSPFIVQQTGLFCLNREWISYPKILLRMSLNSSRQFLIFLGPFALFFMLLRVLAIPCSLMDSSRLNNEMMPSTTYRAASCPEFAAFFKHSIADSSLLELKKFTYNGPKLWWNSTKKPKETTRRNINAFIKHRLIVPMTMSNMGVWCLWQYQTWEYVNIAWFCNSRLSLLYLIILSWLVCLRHYFNVHMPLTSIWTVGIWARSVYIRREVTRTIASAFVVVYCSLI